ncbi:hypothetical protein BH10PSE7_BH10PSE7_21580 [soil metagenome]
MNVTKRTFLTVSAGFLPLALGLSPSFAQDQETLSTTDGTVDSFPIPEVDLRQIPEQFHRQVVPYNGTEYPGTIVVNTKERHLYKVMPDGQAIRYGVGVGREGFLWSGMASIGAKQMWPRWNPPPEMVARDPNAAKWADGQPGGPTNPLGARALYLYQEGKDTLFRIHGTNAPKSIGKAMSSGCIRMLNQDVVEVYRQTPVGTPVVVLTPMMEEQFEQDEALSG